jgi:hypothetical protein
MPSGFFGRAVVLGIGVVFESNIPDALNSALEVFPDCNDDGTALPAPPVYVVLTADHHTHTPTREHQVCGKRLRIADNGIRILADGECGRASCSFRVDVIGSELFREAVSTATLFLATHRGRVPVHASAVLIGDHAYVLAGRSGSGKSTLALAGTRAGLPMLAEDTVFVQLEPAFRIWGASGHIHVFEKDAPAGTVARPRLRSGRLKLAVPIGDVRYSGNKAVLCVIAHGESVRLEPLSCDDAVDQLTGKLEPGYDLFAPRMEEAIRAIAVGGCWRLTLSQDSDAAIAALIDSFDDAPGWQFG